MMPKSIIIIGGGLTGLAAGCYVVSNICSTSSYLKNYRQNLWFESRWCFGSGRLRRGRGSFNPLGVRNEDPDESGLFEVRGVLLIGSLDILIVHIVGFGLKRFA